MIDSCPPDSGAGVAVSLINTTHITKQGPVMGSNASLHPQQGQQGVQKGFFVASISIILI